MDSENQPLVSIIIVNYNGKEHLQKCLDSIKKNGYKNYEIILVDNNSKDGSRNFVKDNYSDIRIIELDKNYGFAKPNNLGSEKAIGELLYFLNNILDFSECISCVFNRFSIRYVQNWALCLMKFIRF